jgi:hypothetical protein
MLNIEQHTKNLFEIEGLSEKTVKIVEVTKKSLAK